MTQPLPRQIGRYEIVQQLATGGMATVYLARVTGPGGFRKLFALKTIHPHLALETGFIEMFLDEARLASRISHPNVCEVVDFGVGKGSYFIVMELLLGEPLNKVRKLLPKSLDPPRDLGIVARVVADAAEGLHAAHEATGDDGELLEVVHRDVSHSNLFVTFDGTTKVVDFGIASAADQLHLTRTGTIKGKLGYMAPEQIEQQPVDRRADVWSLGVVLWELLTGERLFRRPRQVETMRAVLEFDIPPPSSIRPDVPSSLDRAVGRALTRERDDRFSTALAFAEALNNVQRAEGWAVGARNIGEGMRRLASESFARQSELVAQARSGEGPGSGRVATERQSSDAPTIDTRRASGARPTRESRRSRWRVAGALLFGALLMTGAYLAGSSRTQNETAAEDSAGGSPPAPPPPVSKPADPAASPETDRPLPSATPSEELPIATQRANHTSTPSAAETPQKTKKLVRRPPRATAFGFVNITTPGGWADVFVSGRRLGRSPFRARLTAGRHRLVLKPFGRGQLQRTVTIRSRRVSRLVVPVQAP